MDTMKYKTQWKLKGDYSKWGKCGLANAGNTCFLNSLLQCLLHTLPLTDYIMMGTYARDIEQENKTRPAFKLFYTYFALIQNVWTKHQVFVPNKLAHALIALTPRLTFGRQEDAMEALDAFLDHLDTALSFEIEASPKEELLNPITQLAIQSWRLHFEKEYSIVKQLFHGQFHSMTRCNCNVVSHKFDPFCALRLEVMNNRDTSGDSIRGRDTLESCLKHYTSIQTLPRYECDTCKKSNNALQNITIFTPPKILIIQLKRFTGNNTKIDTLIDFPLDVLNMTPFISPDRPFKNQVLYECFGVINHNGFTGSGHYYAYCKNSMTNEWMDMNDAAVHSLSPNQIVTSNAYILFYQRKN